MKARQDFVMYVNKDGVPIPHKSGEPLEEGAKKITVLRKHDVPQEIEKDVLMHNKEFLDIKFKDGKPVVPEHLQDVKAPPLLEKRKYSEEGLYKVFEKDGMEGLKKIGATFTPLVTDRSRNRLITEILAAQERIRRTGK